MDPIANRRHRLVLINWHYSITRAEKPRMTIRGSYGSDVENGMNLEKLNTMPCEVLSSME